MKTYIVTREVILKYAHIFGINPEEWKDGPLDEKWVIAREKELPFEVTYEVTEVQSYIEDDETGLRYEPTLFDFEELGGFKG